ncbi:hypothetical protein I4F81_004809 [Pyropia yezoensis]|uniref:Uncharacterized protein n=1 Tax=Pyropia yezoensis TaxID=2788 RepID=A0ACC3BWX9_PYRYE|nr:hypothetical protein I4F81_004809 [Neopyropia yezoensis]
MAYNTFSAPGFVRVVPLPVRRVSPGNRLGGGLLATSKRVVPAAVAASSDRASAVARTLLAAAALSLLCVTPASAASLDNGQAVFENSCAAYSGYLVVPAHVGRSCHAGGGNIIGFSRGKTLKADKLAKYGFTTPESVAGLVRSGKGVMPGYDLGQLSDSEVVAVSQFVIDAAERGWK